MQEEISQETIERDKLLLDLMLRNYDEEERRNELIDSKNSQMIILTGAMLTLQSTLFTNLLVGYVFNSLMVAQYQRILIILMILSLFFYVISMFYFIKSYQLKDFKQAPLPNFLLKKHEKNVVENEIISTILKKLPNIIESNKKVIADKINISKKGFRFLKLGCFSTAIFVLIFLIYFI